MRASIAMIAVGAILAAAPPGGGAAVRGSNGDIAFRRYLNADRSTGAIFTIGQNGRNERQVTRPPAKTVDDQPDWAPDGSLLAFIRCPSRGSCAVYTVHPDGAKLTRISPACPTGGRAPACE